ncbi:MAG: M56 family metallopeptidase [Thermomicrobiales bacterium]
MDDRQFSLPASLLWVGVALLSLVPAPLAPVARLYHALCTPFPALAVLGGLIPPLPLALLLLLLGIIVGVGLVTGIRELLGALCVARGLDRLAAPAPSRLGNASRRLGLEHRLTYLATPAPAALCYGILRPRIAVSAGMVDRLDDEELVAVLLHERHHLRRRDPLRYLALHAFAAGLFMVPLAPVIQRWAETRIELAADRAALKEVPRGALAGALMVALTATSVMPAGLAPLSATEARIAHLAGRSERPTVPFAAGLMTVGLMGGLGLALAWLASPEQLRELICALCPELA